MKEEIDIDFKREGFFNDAPDDSILYKVDSICGILQNFHQRGYSGASITVKSKGTPKTYKEAKIVRKFGEKIRQAVKGTKLKVK